MNILFVVSQHQDWPVDIPGVTVIPATTYLMDPACGDGGSTKVINLCTTYRYQNDGYYVSLLAEARGHQPTPDIETIRDLQSSDLVRMLGEQIGELIDCSLSREADDFIDLHICFGRDLHERHTHLCMQIFRLLQTPFLHARFERADRRWHLCGIYPGSVRGVPELMHRL